MKKFFTLIACALVAGSAFAQNGWTPVEGQDGFVQKQVITNGNIAYNKNVKEGFDQYPKNKLVNFIANDYPQGDEGEKVETDTARVTVDPADADAFAEALADNKGLTKFNYCIVVGSHSNPKNNYDSQFFITFGEDNVLQEGDKVTVSMKVKAEIGSTDAVYWTQEEIDAAQEGDPAFGKTTSDVKTAAVSVKASSQGHRNPGGYKHWAFIGDVPFTTEWVEYTKENISIDSNLDGCYTIALNLNDFGTANKYYFDDISVVVVRAETPTADEEMYDKAIPEGFVDIITNGDLEGEGLDNFVVNDYLDMNNKDSKVDLGTARVITDPAHADNKCIVVTTDASPSQDYDAQFFITYPKHHFYVGDVIRLRMRVKADAAQTSGTQCHAKPGSYIHYACVGDVKFKADYWFNFDSGDITVTSQMVGSKSPFATIALNLSKVAAGNNVYFDDIQLLVKQADPLAAAKSDLTTAVAYVASEFQKTETSLNAFKDAVAEGEALLVDGAEPSVDELVAAFDKIDAAFAGLEYVSGYTPLSKDMFKDYTDAANPVATNCTFSTYESVDCTFGTLKAPATKYADVSDYDELVVISTGDTKPRVIINAEKGDDKLDISLGTTESDYVRALEDVENAFVIDLAAIAKDQGFAHLNAIRKPGNDAGITVTDMVLGKGTATSITEAKAQKVAKVIFNVAGQQMKNLQKGLNIVDGKKIYVK